MDATRRGGCALRAWRRGRLACGVTIFAHSLLRLEASLPSLKVVPNLNRARKPHESLDPKFSCGTYCKLSINRSGQQRERTPCWPSSGVGRPQAVWSLLETAKKHGSWSPSLQQRWLGVKTVQPLHCPSRPTLTGSENPQTRYTALLKKAAPALQLYFRPTAPCREEEGGVVRSRPP